MGSALALFPIIGTTTTLCVVAGISLGLNQPIIQGVNALCTFIYFPLIVAFVRLGDLLSGSARTTLDIPYMMSVFSHHPREFFQRFGVVALHSILGWAVVVPPLDPARLLRGARAPERGSPADRAARRGGLSHSGIAAPALCFNLTAPRQDPSPPQIFPPCPTPDSSSPA